MVKRVARVVSKDESRAILTGVLITFEGETLKMVATDSYRLAITEARAWRARGRGLPGRYLRLVPAGACLPDAYGRPADHRLG